MSVTLAWHDATKTTLEVVFSPGYTLRDVERGWEGIHSFLTQVKHRVDVRCIFSDQQSTRGASLLLGKLANDMPINLGIFQCVGGM